MPAPCVVPLCTERKGGHSFPKDATLTKKWLLAIRRSYFKPTKFSRICKKHFVPEDYQRPKVSYAGRLLLKPDAVPTVFAWTVEELETQPKSQRKRSRKKMTNIEVDYKKLYESAIETDCDSIFSNMSTAINVPNLEISKHFSNVLDEAQTKSNRLNVENFELDDEKIKFYTGFDSFGLFMYVFSFFEGDVRFGISKTKLNICNEFFLVCIKLRCKMTDEELCDEFVIHTNDVQIIFTAWINYLFFKLQNYLLWIPESLQNVLSLCPDRKARIYIVTSPIMSKLKLSVIVSKTGNIIYVSKCFNGNTTDQEMFLSINLTDILLQNKQSLGDNELSWSKNELHDSDLSIKTVSVERVHDLEDTFRCLNVLSEYSEDITPRIMFLCFVFDRILYHIKTDTQ